MNVDLSELPSSSLAPIDTPPSPGLDLNANRNPRVVGVAAFLFVITFIIVTLRFVGRYLSKAGIWWDDWLCLAAMLVAWGTCILCFASPGYNFGKHEAATDLMTAVYDSQAFFKALYAYETLYTIAVALAKYSIILFYGRIFTEKSFRRALWVMGGLVTLWYIAVQIVQLVQCRPLSALWDGTYAENCIDVVRMFTIAGSVNCFFNFVLLVMPLPMVWGLEIDLKAKIGLSITFLLGIFVFAVSLARLVITAHLRQVDVTWTYVDAAIWTTVEPNIAVVSASLPILRSLWILLQPHRSIHTRSTQDRGLQKSTRRDRDPTQTEKTVVFADKDSIMHSPAPPKTPGHSILRGLSTRTRQSFHHNTPVSSAYGGSSIGGNDIVSPIYDGGYMSPGGISEMSGPMTGGGVSRKPTVGGRSENSMTPLTSASELSAHRSIPYGGGEYSRYTVNISSENGPKPSIASRMSIKSPKLGVGGSSPRTVQNSGRSSFDETRSFEMTKLPIQGGMAMSVRGNTPSPGPQGPVKIERVQGSGRRQQSGRDSGSLSGYPPVAELYA